MALVAASAANGQSSRILTGKVVRVDDGDSISVRLDSKRTERVRYIGMNAPELTQRGGPEAGDANRKLVGGQSVRLELDVEERDRHGRLLAYVYLGDMMVNAELVAQGWAQAMTIPPNMRYQQLFLRRQREARALQVGMWQDTGPPPPPPGAAALPRVAASSRPGVNPQDPWNCPMTHPIKGNFTPHSDERCIYHPPGGEFYSGTKPERCYRSGEEAVRDGCRASKR